MGFEALTHHRLAVADNTDHNRQSAERDHLESYVDVADSRLDEFSVFVDIDDLQNELSK